VKSAPAKARFPSTDNIQPPQELTDMLSLASIYQSFRKGNYSLTTTQRFALVTVAAMTGHYGWLKLTPAELGDNIGVERRTSYRLMAWMKAIGFLLPVDVLYDRKQVNHVFICGLPIEQSDVDNALAHIQKHFTVTNRQKTRTIVPTVTSAPLDIPGLPAIAGALLPGAKLYPDVAATRPHLATTPLPTANVTPLPHRIVPPKAQNSAPKRVTHDTECQKVSPVAQNCRPNRVTGDIPCKKVPPMTLTSQGSSNNFSDLSAASSSAPLAVPMPGARTGGPITGAAAVGAEAAAPAGRPTLDLTAAGDDAILGAGEKRNPGSQKPITIVDPINTTPIGGDVLDTAQGTGLTPFAEGSRVLGEKIGQRAQRPPRPTQRSFLSPAEVDPAATLVSRWLQIIHTPRPAEPDLSRDYLQPARELLALTAGDIDEAITRLNARRTQFIEAGYKRARKLSTIGGAILREAEAEQIAARAATAPIHSLFACPVPPQTAY
jgi:hypothetical protein